MVQEQTEHFRAEPLSRGGAAHLRRLAEGGDAERRVDAQQTFLPHRLVAVAVLGFYPIVPVLSQKSGAVKQCDFPIMDESL